MSELHTLWTVVAWILFGLGACCLIALGWLYVFHVRAHGWPRWWPEEDDADG